MKKILLFFLIIIFTINSIFAEKDDFYINGKLIDIMYVNSPEGLKVRSNPGLKSEKIRTIYDRMIVKVLGIDKEETIDGITSNWIKILLPIETKKNKHNVYGYVFGGYLSKNIKPFSTESWTDADLIRYLSRFAWLSGRRTYTYFAGDGSFKMGLLESGAGGNGTYKVSMTNKTITIYAKYGDEDYESDIETDVVNIVSIKENELIVDKNGSNQIYYPAFMHDYFSIRFFRNSVTVSDFDETTLNALFYSFSNEMLKDLYYSKQTEELISNIIKLGIIINWNEGYIQKYSDYWN